MRLAGKRELKGFNPSMDNILKFQISILCLPSRSGHSCQPYLVLLWPRILRYQMGKVGERKSVDCLHNLSGFCFSDRGIRWERWES